MIDKTKTAHISQVPASHLGGFTYFSVLYDCEQNTFGF